MHDKERHKQTQIQPSGLFLKQSCKNCLVSSRNDSVELMGMCLVSWIQEVTAFLLRLNERLLRVREKAHILMSESRRGSFTNPILTDLSFMTYIRRFIVCNKTSSFICSSSSNNSGFVMAEVAVMT